MFTRSFSLRSAIVVGAALASVSAAVGQINYAGGTYSENFDGLPTTNQTNLFSNTIGTQAAIPGVVGWSGAKFAGSGSTATGLTADAGTGASGSIYSYGTGTTAERALGMLASGSNAMAVGAQFVNQTGFPISSVTISFTAEFWRVSSSTQNVLIFSYALDGGTSTATTFLTATDAIPEPALNITGPVPAASAAPLDGNLPANQAAISYTINGLSWAPGASLYIRWSDTDNVGSDAGLAIDNLTLSAVVSTGSDVSRGAGTTFTPSSFGGNAFTSADVALFDGTAATVNVSGAVSAFGVKFTTSGYTVAGTASDSLTVASTIFADTDITATISAVLAGGSGVIKNGPGTLTLTGANTFTGGLSVSAGRLVVGADSAFGAADNDVTVNGTLQITSGNFTFGAGRTLGGTGTVETPAGGDLTLSGSVNAGALTFAGLDSLTFGGATNVLTTLTLPQTANVAITGGALEPASGILINQGSGTSVITGTIAFGSSGDRTVAVAGGTLELDATVSLGGRLIKTGAGTLDLTGGAFSGTTGTNGGIRLGVQGGTPVDGGVLVIDEAASLGNLQMHLNSGTLTLNAPVTTAVGVSIGARRGGAVSPAVITGSDLVFNGASSFFNAAGATGALGVNVNNTTTINGTIPVIAAAGPIGGYVELGGSGTFIIGSTGDASALTDNFAITDSLTFVMNGSFGGRLIDVDPSATLAGAGTFTGTTIAETRFENRVRVYGLLAPSGNLTFNSALVLSSSQTILTIGGAARGSDYDAVTVANPASDGSYSFDLAYSGSLTLDFTAPALSGTYDLFSIGTNVTRSGSFSSVGLTGLYATALSQSGTVWSGTSGLIGFSFDESTGVLTVTGGGSALSPIEEWRQANFGTTENTGTAADSADFDGDGIPNLIEYATGTEPDAFNASAVVPGRDGDFLTLSYTTISDASLTYAVKATSDLAVAFTPGAGTTSAAGGITTYKDNVSLSTAGVRRFLRLEVTRTE